MIGLLGGTFNPPHNGHVALARGAIAHFDLESLIVMVAGRPPHKEAVLDGETRFRLAEAAFGDIPRIELSRYELDRDVDSYSIDTVRHLQRTRGELILLVGADVFADFLTWREPETILELVRIGVATRPGYAREQLEPVLTSVRRPERVELFEVEPVPVSSREIRARIARGEKIEDLVPPAVARVIQRDALYAEG